MVKNQFGKTIKIIRSDNGAKFPSSQSQSMLAKFGISHQKRCVYTPQQNGIVERRHKTIYS